MTHIDNIAHISEHGITHIHSAHSNPIYRPIGDSSLIIGRNEYQIPGGGKLGKYIPFYFGFRMPMLYVIQNGFNGLERTPPQDIVYCVSSVGQVVKHGLRFLFTDGHALSGLSNFYNSNSVGKITSLIDQEAIATKYWAADSSDTDLKRRKEAEFLVADDLPVTAIVWYVVYNEEVKSKLLLLDILESKIIVRDNFYF